MSGTLRARIERAVGGVVRPSLECDLLPDEVAIVDAVMEALAHTADVTPRVEAQLHLSRELPAPAELQALRTRVGLTQQQVGDIVGVTGAAVAQWERGVCSPQRGTVERARYRRLIDDLAARRRQEAVA